MSQLMQNEGPKLSFLPHQQQMRQGKADPQEIEAFEKLKSLEDQADYLARKKDEQQQQRLQEKNK